MELTPDTVVGVVGAGTMGSGIAQTAAANGHRVILMDANPEALQAGMEKMAGILNRRVERGKMAREEADGILHRIEPVQNGEQGGWGPLEPCGLVAEAILEILDLKKEVFAGVEKAVSSETVLATNTSSLSVAAIASACDEPSRVVGMHFFNPVPVMPLVEVVGALTTDPAVTREARGLAEGWGKVPVLASDTPGFIVNRIARPFYGEALRMAEEGLADFATIDWAMREVGGFRMGPFELMDLIGNDVNYAVNASVFEGLHLDPRYRPSILQRRLVEAGRLGRKSGRGFYDYRNGAELPEPSRDQELAQEIVDRILAMLINEAVEAVRVQVARPEDIELAMTRGVGYPRGLLAWGEALGWSDVLGRLTTLREEYGEERYRPSPLLRQLAREGKGLLS